jgi:LacI family transcriptional regulator
MARRPTIIDLARAAGVGVATVDRALHGRTNVSASAMARISEAAARIGFHAPSIVSPTDGPAPQLRLGFVLHKGSQEFYRNFALHLEAACAARTDHRITAEIRFSSSQSPDDFCAELRAAAQTCDAVATSAVTHPSIAQLSEQLVTRGIPVFAVLNDFGRASHSGYYGLDNIKAGRLASWMMALKLQAGGRVAVFVGGNRWHGHALRETGFRSFLRENASQIIVMDTLVNLETRQITYEATLDLLERHHDLRGIYVAGGGMEGAIAALREVRPPEKVALIVNELTEESRAALAERYALMAIATPLEPLSRQLVAQMVADTRGEARRRQDQVLFDPVLWLPESA